jgi:uncharacterized membrane protein
VTTKLTTKLDIWLSGHAIPTGWIALGVFVAVLVLIYFVYFVWALYRLLILGAT